MEGPTWKFPKTLCFEPYLEASAGLGRSGQEKWCDPGSRGKWSSAGWSRLGASWHHCRGLHPSGVIAGSMLPTALTATSARGREKQALTPRRRVDGGGGRIHSFTRIPNPSSGRADGPQEQQGGQQPQRRPVLLPLLQLLSRLGSSGSLA